MFEGERPPVPDDETMVNGIPTVLHGKDGDMPETEAKLRDAIRRKREEEGRK